MSDTETKKGWLERIFKSDAWANVVTGLGLASRDKRLGASPADPMAWDWAALENLYYGDDIMGRVIDLPAQEMTRQWLRVRCQEEDAAKQMEQRLDDLDVQSKTQEAIAWARLYGGSILLLGVDDGEQDLTKPLRKDRIRSFDWLTVLDRWDVTIEQWYRDPFGPQFGEPELYRINNALGEEVAQSVVHESRVVRFDGLPVGRRRRRQLMGWADSVVTRIWEPARDFSQAWGGASNLLADFAQGVFKIDGLARMLAADEDGLVIKRLQMLDMARSIARAIPVDAEHEDFVRQATPVAGLPDLLDRMAQRLSAATGIPVTLLMGQAPAGLQATGDSDIRLFYDKVKADQERMLRPRLNRVVELLWLAENGPTNGKEPDDWSLEFRPLWQLTEQEEAELRKSDADTAALLIQWEVVPPEAVALAMFGGDHYTGEITLEPEVLDAMRTALEAKLEKMAEPPPEPPTNPPPFPPPAPGTGDPTQALLPGQAPQAGQAPHDQPPKPGTEGA